ncbi:hypothetical protein TW65_06622 [Stemphylium lycopersici]|nr:hypothetical protein TW65_06622 [Stemphylium lycopersici]
MENSNLVSWQTVFWGLAPIAVNSMGQPAGKVCDAPSAIGFWLRVSPIICFLDMLSILYRLVSYTISQGSVSKASKIILTQRYTYDYECHTCHKAREAQQVQEDHEFEEAPQAHRDHEAQEAQNSINDNLGDFRKNASLRWVSFLLSISQIVKLYAAQGLVWSKLWASMYLASFLTVEMFVLISRKALSKPLTQKLESEHQPRRSGPKSLPYISVAASTIFASYFIIQAVASALEQYGRPFNKLGCTGIVLLVGGGGAFIPSYFYMADTLTKNETSRISNDTNYARLLLFAILAVPSVYLLASLEHDNSPLATKTMKSLVPVMIAVWAAICLVLASIIFKKADSKAGGLFKDLDHALSKYFLFINVTAAALYYGFSYDPQGTYKPPWTERLG